MIANSSFQLFILYLTEAVNCQLQSILFNQYLKMSSRKWNRKCFVPGCSSNNYDEPLKAFIKLPSGTAIRKQWAQVVGRTGKDVYFNPVSSVYCCGDHFNLEEDAENWMKYRIMGGTIKLKPGVLPRISKDPLSLEKASETKQSAEKHNGLQPDGIPGSHKDIGYNIIGTETIDEHSIDIKYEPVPNIVKTESEEPSLEQIYIVDRSNVGYQSIEPKHKSFSHKDIQCNMSTRKHVRSKSTQTDKTVLTCSRATSTIKFIKLRKR